MSDPFAYADELMEYNSETYQEKKATAFETPEMPAPLPKIYRDRIAILVDRQRQTPGCPIPLVGGLITFD